MLLAFMSSWDRAAVLEDYAARLDGAEDPAALMRELGTPTRASLSGVRYIRAVNCCSAGRRAVLQLPKRASRYVPLA